MKTKFISALVLIATLFAAGRATAQTSVVIEDQYTYVAPAQSDCKTNYYSSSSKNWFIEFGAGINSPFVENYLPNGGEKHHITVAYTLGFGRWMSPYLGWRVNFLGGPLHWDNVAFSKSKYVNANFDLMWDMFNTFGSVNSKRVFSVVPFVGLGGTFSWDFKAKAANIMDEDKQVKRNQWTLPVSAGIELRFRMCRYADFFLQGRAQFYGDNFNNTAYGQPVDVNIAAVGGFRINIGGAGFKSYNPCDNADYIASLNAQVNALRESLAATAAQLAEAEAQLPCPEVKEQTVVQNTPLMSTVRFDLNSAEISQMEAVNVYNVAQWMKANPDQNVTIVGYADRDTGSEQYNLALSERRANAVAGMLVNDYGIDSSRLNVKAEGSSVQPYESNNNWNRIVIFSVAK